jgi:hypothetical protein
MQRRPAALLLLSAALCGLPAFADGLRGDTTGFYPIWENTGHVEEAGDVRLGTMGAQVGVGGIAHAGVQPVNFIYRAPNAYLKVQILRAGRWRVAAQAGGMRLMQGASRSFFSPMYSTRLDNPDFGITLVPVSVSASAEVASWLEIHQTLTGLGVVTGGPLRNGVTPGYSAVAELNPRGRHALSLHLGETGAWAHDLAVAGASYRYRNGWMEFRLGYFYRFTKAGVQAAPLVGLGVLL